MSVRTREKSLSKNSESSKQFERSSGHGSCSTLENDPFLEYKKMKQTLHNLFQVAKKQFALIYQSIINQVGQVGQKLKQTSKITQQMVQHISEVRKIAETVMPELSSKLSSALVVPKIIRKLFFQEDPESDYYAYGHLKPQPRKKIGYSSSSSKKQQSFSSLDLALNRNTAKKIKSNNIKHGDNLQFLQGNWPSLEAVSIQQRQISSIQSFQTFNAQYLQIINLSKNEINQLGFLKNSSFPHLRELNLSKNRIKYLDGIEVTKFPKLIILNLCNNAIGNLHPLTLCSFSELLQLNLEQNRLQSIQPLNRCDFGNLEILNVDSNRLANIDSLSSLPFYRLKVLSFSRNLINSIAFMSRMSLRRLQGLLAHNNRITSIQPLVQSSFPALQEIILHNNQISDISCIKRMNFPQLTGLDLQSNQVLPKVIGCFVTNDKGFRDAKKKFPFILI